MTIPIETNNTQAGNDADILTHGIQTIFTPGKFSTPGIDKEFHLFRHVAIRPLMAPATRYQHVVLIEARAGQGKSTLAAQFLHHTQNRHAWLQVGPEDRDPVLFITAVFTTLLKSVPGLAKTSVYQTITKGQVVIDAAQKLAQVLAEEIAPLLKTPFYLVVDDLYLAKDEPVIDAFINALVRNAPANLRFILISRMPVSLDAELRKNALRLDNNSLALTHNDTAELFSSIFKNPLPPETVTALHQHTEGWIMGLILASHTVNDHQIFQAARSQTDPPAIQPEKFNAYFQAEILDSLTTPQRHSLLCLGLLDNIPLKLAESLGLIPDTGAFLEYLVSKNYFLRRIEENPACYCFHHLFREFLSNQAEKELAENRKRSVLARAGQWLLRRKRHEQALQYYLKARAYGMVEKILRDVGLQLLATNRIATLQEAMAKVPPEMVRTHAWLSFFIASIYVRNDPFQCPDYLEQARRKFIEADEPLGELMATTTLIMFHAGIDCRFKKGQTLLRRAESLYETMADKLSVAARIQSAYAIVYGLCYFEGAVQQAAPYVTSSLRLAREHDLDDALAATAVARGLIRSIEGNWVVFRQEIEQSLHLCKSPRVSGMTRLGLLFQELTLLGMEGDFTTFGNSRRILEELADLLAKSIFGPLLYITDINEAIFKGELQGAERLIHEAMALGGSAQSDHMQSQFQSYLAYVAALNGQKDAALAAAHSAADLRHSAGGAYHAVINQMILGGVYALLDMRAEADSLLSEAISGSKAMGELFLRAGAYAHRAHLRLAAGEEKPALEDIRNFLQAMKQGGYEHFFTFNPVIMPRLLCTAVKNDVEADWARMLATDRLQITVTPDGEQIPILEIVTLGRLELRLQGETRAIFSDFTSGQRQLLALLAGAPDMGLSHEIIQVDFWPESAPAKVRSKLDNLLARLRKVLNGLLAPLPAGNYLAMEKGFVRLQNCRVDARRFSLEAKQGLRHTRRAEFKQADNAFVRAQHLYRGPFMPGVELRDASALFRDDLQRLYLESASQWSGILLEMQRFEEAIQVCRTALQYDSTHQPLVKLLYHLLTQTNDAVQARQAIKNYQKSLAEDGFSPREIDEIMDDFWRG